MNIIKEYEERKKDIFKYFEVKDEYYINNSVEYKWDLVSEDEHSLLVIWKSNNKKESFITLRRNNDVVIFEKDDYTMIIAIDCIKVAFILKNSNKHAD